MNPWEIDKLQIINEKGKIDYDVLVIVCIVLVHSFIIKLIRTNLLFGEYFRSRNLSAMCLKMLCLFVLSSDCHVMKEWTKTMQTMTNTS